MPRTRDSLLSDIRQLGLEAGDCVIVHSSLSSLGYVEGGAATVVGALMDAVTLDGAIVMPTQTAQFQYPTHRIPPVTDISQFKRLMAETPVFDPASTPTTQMGAIPEHFRTQPGVVRSAHPLYSFAAWSRDSAAIAGTQRMEMSMGEGSALDHLYRRDGKALLMGVGFIRYTMFHHAEYGVDVTPTNQPLVPIPNVAGDANDWRPTREICFIDNDTITRLGESFAAENSVSIGSVGNAEARLFSARDAIDYGVEWLTREYAANRVTTNCKD